MRCIIYVLELWKLVNVKCILYWTVYTEHSEMNGIFIWFWEMINYVEMLALVDWKIYWIKCDQIINSAIVSNFLRPFLKVGCSTLARFRGGVLHAWYQSKSCRLHGHKHSIINYKSCQGLWSFGIRAQGFDQLGLWFKWYENLCL